MSDPVTLRTDLTFAEGEGTPVYPVATGDVAAAMAHLSEAQARFAAAMGFSGGAGQTCVLPDADGAIACVLLGVGPTPATPDAGSPAGAAAPETAAPAAPEDTPVGTPPRDRFALGAAIAGLPAGTYRLERGLSGALLDETALGALLARYRFDRYRAQPAPAVQLTAPPGVDAGRLQILAAAEALTRDLINTPAEDMGPGALAASAQALGEEHGAEVAVTVGDDLLERNFPLIHTVGRAADRDPRLIEMTWGGEGPTLTLAGKGVCFDTGGLNLKSGSNMRLMKKDMGGAATVLGLAHAIMALKMPLRLRVLIPAVENAVSDEAYRPGDILTARNGRTVEISNTDAEGRLVLADALALAAEDPPDLCISMATLTGAARIALGPDIAPFYTDDDRVAEALAEAAEQTADPVWRMPFHAPYEAMLDPGIADLDNAPGPMAGSVTAALFLRRFAPPRFTHFDIYGWQPKPAPARPKGGVGQGARAILAALPEVLGL